MDVNEELYSLSVGSEHEHFDDFMDEISVGDQIDIGAMPSSWMADVFGSDISAVVLSTDFDAYHYEDIVSTVVPVEVKPEESELNVDIEISERDEESNEMNNFSSELTEAHETSLVSIKCENSPKTGFMNSVQVISAIQIKCKEISENEPEQKCNLVDKSYNESLSSKTLLRISQISEKLIDETAPEHILISDINTKEQFSSESKWTENSDTTKNRQIFYCPYCVLCDHELATVRQHINSMHKKLATDMDVSSQNKQKSKIVGSIFHCPYCRKKTNDFALIQEHIGKRHRKQLKASAVQVLQDSINEHSNQSFSAEESHCLGKRKKTKCKPYNKGKLRKETASVTFALKERVYKSEAHLMEQTCRVNSHLADLANRVIGGSRNVSAMNKRMLSRQCVVRSNIDSKKFSLIKSEEESKRRKKKQVAALSARCKQWQQQRTVVIVDDSGIFEANVSS